MLRESRFPSPVPGTIKMGRFLLIVVALVVVILVGGTVFLMFWNIPAPTTHVEKVIPDARFPR
jgi:hypothetical protein